MQTQLQALHTATDKSLGNKFLQSVETIPKDERYVKVRMLDRGRLPIVAHREEQSWWVKHAVLATCM